ncbi:hypothetical protein QEH40_gp44 [Microbacterium phage OscarSo]|uniref:Uncharacterized protein n=1 Tax=Microbacterium phage OscarSo TaxID=2985324 RepID=A0A9X9K2V5_9CAUD|nr:hypothetical protein QEH40_gp44 [Microbacterium phage OscarSo]UYL87165.1 hypothetical protein SEA_OSCARSO_44 [Microbacterium phage OscarSo]
MSKKTTWADVRKGDLVELAGREYVVRKIKAGKKKADVKVERKGRTAESTVKLADRVTIVAKGDGSKHGPLTDEHGTARRWATKKEAREVLGESAKLEAGDPSATKPPAKATGDPWETPHGRIERKLDEILGARLVGESTGPEGYYVPPVNVTTIAAHMAVFHGGIPEACDDEGKMMLAHAAQHDAAKKGESVLAVNHWHTEKRPA